MPPAQRSGTSSFQNHQTKHLPIPDFRTVGDRPVDRPSGNLLDTIYQCQQRQDWYRDYVRSSGMRELKWVASLQPNTPPEDAAQRIRSALSFNVQQRGGQLPRSVHSVKAAGRGTWCDGHG